MQMFLKKFIIFKCLIFFLFFCSFGINANEINVLQFQNAKKLIDDKKYQEAISILTPLAENNFPSALLEMGKIYDFGKGTNIDYPKAMDLYIKAAKLGNPEAHQRIGALYDFGDGVDINHSKAMDWYLKAVELGDPGAHRSIGFLYEFGDGVDVDSSKAMDWYLKAAELEDPVAHLRIGVLYYFGDGVDVDYSKAMDWYLKAAELEDPDAHQRIGTMYYFGNGVDVDYSKAMEWYLKAAELDDPEAHRRIGKLYQFGDGVDVDLDEALIWYKSAVKLGDINSNIAIIELYYDKGNWTSALEKINIFMQTKDFVNLSIYDRITTLELLGLLKSDLNDNEGSAIVFESILSLTRKDKYSDGLTKFRAHTNLAIQQTKINRFFESEKNLDKAMEYAQNDDNKYNWDVANTLGNYAFLFSNKSDYLDSKKYMNMAIKFSLDAIKTFELCCEGDSRIGLYHGNLGEYYQSLGKLEKAEKNFLKALEIRVSNGDINHPDNIDFLTNLSKFYLEKNQPQDALKYSKVAYESYKNLLESNNTNIKKQIVSSDEDILFIHNASIIKNNKENSIRDAFLISQTHVNFEMSKYFNFNSFMKSNEKQNIKNIFKKYWKKNDELSKLEKSINTLLLKENLNSLDKKLQNFNQTREIIKSDLLTLKEKLQGNSKLFDQIYNVKPLSISETRNYLGENEALISFDTSNSLTHSQAYIITKKGEKTYEINLTEDEIKNIVTKLRLGTDLKNLEKLPEFNLNLAHELYLKLFGPAENLLKNIQHLLFVPTGSLGSIPLNILVTEEPRNIQKKNIHKNYLTTAWLTKKYSVTRLPTISSLQALRTFKTENIPQNPFIGFGDPILNKKIGEIRGIRIQQNSKSNNMITEQISELPELPETSNELKIIAQYLQANKENIYLRERATETVLKNINLSNTRVVAFATHGLLGGEIDGLIEPALVLSPPNLVTKNDDGLLKASEITQLSINADMILLSACNTASSNKIGSEGLSSLARAFIYAGAKSLLVSHWSIESSSASKITTGIFYALEKNPNIGRAKALQDSILKLMQDPQNPHYAHPAFWAPFSLIGDGLSIQN